jgi:hypothetical protein
LFEKPLRFIVAALPPGKFTQIAQNVCKLGVIGLGLIVAVLFDIKPSQLA